MAGVRGVTSVLVLCAGLAACATQGGAEPAEPEARAEDAPAAAEPAKGGAATTPKAAAAPYVWETWPPPDAAPPVARPAPSGEVVELPTHPQGVAVLDLLAFVTQQTGTVFLYDEGTNPKIRTARVQYVGAWRVPRSRVLDTVRTAFATNNLVLVPVGTPEQSGAWAVLDQNNPAVKSKPVYVPENELLGYADCDGLYVVTSLRVRDTVDISRVRQALTAITSVVAGGGRIQDVPAARTIVVADFAPVAAAMKRLVDEMNRIAVAPPPPSAAPAK
jgi:hypothetical protein